jgi:hypothetical protein
MPGGDYKLESDRDGVACRLLGDGGQKVWNNQFGIDTDVRACKPYYHVFDSYRKHLSEMYCAPPPIPALDDFNARSHSDACSRSQQLILFLLGL